MEKILDLIRRIRDNKQRVLVFGAGKTGMALANFFVQIGIATEVWDQASRSKFVESSKNQENLNKLEQQEVRFYFEAEQQTVSSDIALLVTSPGISPKSKFFKIDRISDLPKIGELELGMQLFAEGHGTKQIVTTGSNGKSTTTALIHYILKTLHLNSVPCGNIGEPIIGKVPANVLDEPNKQDLILTIEASSYQLEDCQICKPDVAVMLNLTENHLERHGNMAAYLEAKKNLVRRFDRESILVVNADDSYCNDFCADIDSKLMRFGCSAQCDARIDLQAGQVVFETEGLPKYIQTLGHLIGAHNLYNIAAAILACQSIGCDLESCINAAYKFEGLEHRLEKIRVGAEGLAINDSKATTVSASLAAIKAVVESGLNRKIILLLGGEEKSGSDWSPLVDYINQKPQAFEQLWLFGECRNKLKSIFETVAITVELFDSLVSSAKEMKARLTSDSLILLSPGCASFDEFTDFEDRGRVFKALLAEG